jgi:hypothetical protein
MALKITCEFICDNCGKEAKEKLVNNYAVPHIIEQPNIRKLIFGGNLLCTACFETAFQAIIKRRQMLDLEPVKLDPYITY